jgi:hypothetical protein
MLFKAFFKVIRVPGVIRLVGTTENINPETHIERVPSSSVLFHERATFAR